MSGVDEHKIVRDLRAAGSKYVDSAKGDVMAVMRVYKDLKCDSELYMYPDGKKRQAFKMYGTIPVNYRGSIYNIPISIYLWDSHPYYAPICNVVPTATMIIKESEHVNKQGRVFLPYLNEWRFPGYDLYGLIQMMVMIFQERCPLFARPSGGSSSSSQPAASYTQPAISTPYPTDSTPYPSGGANSTPYPTGSGAAPYPTGGGAAPYPTGAATPYPTSAAFPTPYSAMGSGYNPQSQPTRAAPPVPPPPSDAIRSSLITAVEEKLRNRLRDKLGTTYAEMASMRQTQAELKAGQQRLRVAIETLEKQSKELDGMIDGYSSKKSELDKALADVSTGDEPSIDEAIDASTPLERQLLDAYASDLACDDAYYVMGEALKNGSLPSSEYLRYIRDISRKQFVHRATMRKCRIALGLAT